MNKIPIIRNWTIGDTHFRHFWDAVKASDVVQIKREEKWVTAIEFIRNMEPGDKEYVYLPVWMNQN